jgi:hypothetical protein
VCLLVIFAVPFEANVVELSGELKSQVPFRSCNLFDRHD